jgi:hypothetical protein
MIGLLPQLARDYGVSAAQVAWINGRGGALLTSAGSTLGVAHSCPRARVHCIFAGGPGQCGHAGVAQLWDRSGPRFISLSTVLFLFTVGAGYALFTAVCLEFLGGSGKSGSSRYAIINSLGNVPVAYMTWLDGRGYALWGPRGMPGIDAIWRAPCLILILPPGISFSAIRRLNGFLSVPGSLLVTACSLYSGSARLNRDCHRALGLRESPTRIR